MDVDGPSNLKRSSSAPMINEINNGNTTLTSSNHDAPRGDTNNTFNVFAAALPRTRRFSASCSPLVTESPRLSSARVTQLRREERLEAVHCRELEHERELHSAMQMSQSCEDLALLSNNNGTKDVTMARCSSPISPAPGSMSPTRDRQTPTRMYPISSFFLRRPLSPSPTRKTFMSRRSLSPIAMRPSALTPVKRKFELDNSDGETMGSPGSSSSSGYLSPPTKRLNTGTSHVFSSLDGMKSAPLSPGGGRFLFRPLTTSSLVTTPLAVGGSSSRDEPMLDEDEEMILRHKSNSQVTTQQQESSAGTCIKDAVMTSVEPS